VVLTSQRTATTKVWHLQLPPPVDTANGAVGSATPAKVVAFAHATLFSPALSTLESALQKGFLTNFPGLTTQALRKHPPQSYAMVKGHLAHTRKNQQSTKAKPVDFDTAQKIASLPTAPSNAVTAVMLL
jgi:hypothetical protein